MLKSSRFAKHRRRHIALTPRSQRMALLLLIFLVAAFARLWHFQDAPPGLQHDELFKAQEGRGIVENGDWRVFYPSNQGHEGGYVWLLGAVVPAVWRHHDHDQNAAILGRDAHAGVFVSLRPRCSEHARGDNRNRVGGGLLLAGLDESGGAARQSAAAGGFNGAVGAVAASVLWRVRSVAGGPPF